MRTRLLSIVVLAAILLGAGAAGTPVAGNDHPSALAAGINLTTPARADAPGPAAVVRDLAAPMRHAELRLLVLLLTVAVVWAVVSRPHSLDGSLLRWERRARRGPPALA